MHILVIEKNPDLCHLVELHVKLQTSQTLPLERAESPHRAIEILSGTPPFKLIVIGMSMAEEGIYEVLTFLKSKDSNIPVIVFTAPTEIDRKRMHQIYNYVTLVALTDFSGLRLTAKKLLGLS